MVFYVFASHQNWLLGMLRDKKLHALLNPSSPEYYQHNMGDNMVESWNLFRLFEWINTNVMLPLVSVDVHMITKLHYERVLIDHLCSSK